MSDMSIVEYSGERKGYRCGYCDSSSTKYTHGLWYSASICSNTSIFMYLFLF